jgi:FkbM family methyltransferase
VSQDKDDREQFLAAIAPFTSKSKSQLLQDLWAWWESGMKQGGYFVEFGAAGGVRLSNTWLLETTFGWTGIVAEPHPAFWPSLDRNRSCFKSRKCVYSVSGETIEFLALEQGELSRIASIDPHDKHERKGARRNGERIVCETISLNDLLAEAGAPPEIDYLSVDTEGSEFEILSRLDFEAWRFNAISVEHNFTGTRDRVHQLLKANGYRRKWEAFTRFEDWYVRA